MLQRSALSAKNVELPIFCGTWTHLICGVARRHAWIAGAKRRRTPHKISLYVVIRIDGRTHVRSDRAGPVNRRVRLLLPVVHQRSRQSRMPLNGQERTPTVAFAFQPDPFFLPSKTHQSTVLVVSALTGGIEGE